MMTTALVPLVLLLAGTDAVRDGSVRDGAFGFPQKEAVVLCDRADFRLSAWNNDEVLFIQALVWADYDDTLGESLDGRTIGDNAALSLDVDADGLPTPDLDRIYHLNPWPRSPGLHYQTIASPTGQTTHLTHDSQARGSIRYLPNEDGRRVRVDSFAIPLSELGTEPGREIRLAYYVSSPVPELRANSAGFDLPGQPVYIKQIPRSQYHSITLAERTTPLDVSLVPRGRDDEVEPQGTVKLNPTPDIGAVPPPLGKAEWINIDVTPTLESLRGDVLIVDFWRSSCGSCIEVAGLLNRLHDQYADQGLRILGLTEQSRRGVEWVVQNKTEVHYAIGAATDAKPRWGVSSVPYAFLIGRDGKVLWHGRPGAELETRVVEALGE